MTLRARHDDTATQASAALRRPGAISRNRPHPHGPAATISRVIREFQLSTAHSREGDIYEPPTGILRVSVIGDGAYLTWEQQPSPDPDASSTELSSCSFQVSARSLLLALHAAWDDDHPGIAEIDRGPSNRAVRERPVNSHQPWTLDLEAQLRDTWLAATGPAPDLIAGIAEAMGRSTTGIRARLAKIGCDPYVVGYMLPTEDPENLPGAEDPNDPDSATDRNHDDEQAPI